MYKILKKILWVTLIILPLNQESLAQSSFTIKGNSQSSGLSSKEVLDTPDDEVISTNRGEINYQISSLPEHVKSCITKEPIRNVITSWLATIDNLDYQNCEDQNFALNQAFSSEILKLVRKGADGNQKSCKIMANLINRGMRARSQYTKSQKEKSSCHTALVEKCHIVISTNVRTVPHINNQPDVKTNKLTVKGVFRRGNTVTRTNRLKNWSYVGGTKRNSNKLLYGWVSNTHISCGKNSSRSHKFIPHKNKPPFFGGYSTKKQIPYKNKKHVSGNKSAQGYYDKRGNFIIKKVPQRKTSTERLKFKHKKDMSCQTKFQVKVDYCLVRSKKLHVHPSMESNRVLWTIRQNQPIRVGLLYLEPKLYPSEKTNVCWALVARRTDTGKILKGWAVWDKIGRGNTHYKAFKPCQKKRSSSQWKKY